MSIRYFVSALTIYAFMGSVQTRAQESLVTYKSLTPEIALDLARAALADCQKRGYQVAVAIVGGGGPQTEQRRHGELVRGVHQFINRRRGSKPPRIDQILRSESVNI